LYGSRLFTSIIGWSSPQPWRKCSGFMSEPIHGGSQAALRQIEGFLTPSLGPPLPETLTD
jgi:hypothetical protein